MNLLNASLLMEHMDTLVVLFAIGMAIYFFNKAKGDPIRMQAE